MVAFERGLEDSIAGGICGQERKHFAKHIPAIDSRYFYY